jgi:hypothetical protein
MLLEHQFVEQGILFKSCVFHHVPHLRKSTLGIPFTLSSFPVILIFCSQNQKYFNQFGNMNINHFAVFFDVKKETLCVDDTKKVNIKMHRL